MYPQHGFVTSGPKRERQFFLSPIRLSHAGSRVAVTNDAAPGARLETCVPKMAANVLNPLRRRQRRGPAGMHARTLSSVTS